MSDDKQGKLIQFGKVSQDSYREETNKRLVDAVRNGEDINSSFTKMNSWFPPRPLIKKDKEAMARALAGKD